MEFVVSSVKFTPIHPAWENFRQGRNGPIGKDLYKRGVKLQLLAKRSVPRRTGLLAGSIRVSYRRGITNPSVSIGSNLPYAYWVHEGTRPHKIRVRRNRVMRFVVKGRVVYVEGVVNHPGTRPTRYLSKHLRTVVPR